MGEKQTVGGTINELIGAVADSFTRERSERLTRLEERLARLRWWSMLGLAMAFAYFGYRLWGEVHPELGSYSADELGGDKATDEARSSIFLIFAAALGGPVVLLIGYLVVGFLYNVCHDALVRRIPLARFMVVPALLFSGLLLLDARREVLKEALIDGYGEIAHRIALAKSLQQQARNMGAAVREMHQAEAQLQSLSGEPSADEETSAEPETPQGADGETMTQQEAVRRLGGMMLRLQGMNLPQPSREKVMDPSAAPDPAEGQAPAGDGSAMPAPPANPADI